MTRSKLDKKRGAVEVRWGSIGFDEREYKQRMAVLETMGALPGPRPRPEKRKPKEGPAED